MREQQPSTKEIYLLSLQREFQRRKQFRRKSEWWKLFYISQLQRWYIRNENKSNNIKNTLQFCFVARLCLSTRMKNKIFHLGPNGATSCCFKSLPCSKSCWESFERANKCKHRESVGVSLWLWAHVMQMSKRFWYLHREQIYIFWK